MRQDLQDLWYMGSARRNEKNKESGGPTDEPFDINRTLYKVPYTECVDLLKMHQGLLVAGELFIQDSDLKAIVSGKFRAYLSECLTRAKRVAMPAILQDERLNPMLSNMTKAYAGPEFGTSAKVRLPLLRALRGRASTLTHAPRAYAPRATTTPPARMPRAHATRATSPPSTSPQSVDRVTPDEVDALAASSFPLCMRNLHDGLKADHHLKHGGRMQYGLFLKGVGLSMEDALVFWQREFTKKMTPETFLKQYAYNIRHNYGKEGKRADYAAYSCSRIINNPPPGVGDFHGCPYRHWDLNQLRGALGKMSLSSPAIDGILESVRARDFQIACRRQFEARYPGAPSGSVGNHPNAFVEQVQAWSKQKAAAEGAAAVASTVSPASAAASPASVAAAAGAVGVAGVEIGAGAPPMNFEGGALEAEMGGGSDL